MIYQNNAASQLILLCVDQLICNRADGYRDHADAKAQDRQS